jgi:hypothetical protein
MNSRINVSPFTSRKQGNKSYFSPSSGGYAIPYEGSITPVNADFDSDLPSTPKVKRIKKISLARVPFEDIDDLPSVFKKEGREKRSFTDVPFEDPDYYTDSDSDHLDEKYQLWNMTPTHENTTEKLHVGGICDMEVTPSDQEDQIISFWGSNWINSNSMKYKDFINEYKFYCKYSELIPGSCDVNRVRRILMYAGHTFYYKKYLNKRTLYIRR